MAGAFRSMGLSSCVVTGALLAQTALAQEAAPAAPAGEAAAPAEPAPAAAPAAAPATEAAPAPAADAAATPPAEGTAAPAEAAGQADVVADAAQGDSPVELPGKTYRFIGLRYRGIVVPKFMENLFAEGGRTVYVHGVGPEFAIRKNGFEYNLSIWYAHYYMGDTAFKGKDDGEPAWEIINSKLHMLYFTSDFLWSHDFTPEFALNYGVGAGFGLVFGDLFRNQTYPTVDGQDPNDYSKCAGVSEPIESEQFGHYCDEDNDHFGDYTEPSWANGGSKPVVFPWLALQTGLRYKPSRSVVARLDLGFGTSGFFFGIGADYGL